MQVEASFDSTASSYDEQFTHSIIGTLQRNLVYRWLKEDLRGHQALNILEINCGTGADAIWLAARGHRVTATDISHSMIRVAQQKPAPAGNPEFKVAGFEALASHFAGEQFDLIFSNFAGLNCVNEETLAALNKTFASLLKPSGRLIIVMLGKHCLLEKLFFLARSQHDKINRRSRMNMAQLNEHSKQATWCYSPRELKKIFHAFDVSRVKPVGLFIPPSYLESIMKRSRYIVSLCKAFESVPGSWGMFSNYADHFYMVLKRK